MTGGRVEPTELLQRAGLEIMGDWRTEDVLPPRAAWRPVVTYGAEPTVAVRRDRPGLVAELNAQWHRLAVEYGITGEDGVFLIDVAGTRTGSAPKQWTRVRLAKEWDLAGVLGERSGQPEFVAVSTDGDTLLGATTEEYEVWLIAVDRVKERMEEAAKATARETAEEREAAWSSLSLGPGPTERLRQVWADGLGFNPAAPEDVLRRLLGRSSHFLWRKLPSAVVDAAVVHPEWNVRGRFAEAQPDMTAEQWTGLVVRLFLAESCGDAPGDMLLEVWRWWNGSLSYPGRPRTHPNFPRRDLLRYADDPHPRMRQLALDDSESTADLVERFSRDTDVEVRLRAATDPRLSAASAVRLLDDPQERVRDAAARHPRLPARVLVRLLRDTDTAGDAAQNPALPVDLMHRMTDPVQPRSAS
ncbi:hypothetical protein ACH492_01840 [Streptomyces sp. NPDC019443]|uniref:hypothetical protein n=1 Tax=Streptomyces sp. NPDC019443 TaxID=3365061 RepID=UPI0037A6B649